MSASMLRELVDRAWEQQHAQPHESHAWAQDALQRARTEEDASAGAWALLTIGYYELRYASHAQARHSLEAAFADFNRLGDARGRILAGNGIARALMMAGDMQAALETFRRNLEESTEALTTLDRFYTLNGIAGCLAALGDTARALGYLFEALGELRHINARPQLATLLSNLGSELVAVGDYEEALNVLTEARTLASELQHPRLWLTVRVNLAECLLHMGRAAQALPLAREALEDPEAPLASSREGNFYWVPAQVLIATGAFDEARKAIDLATTAAREHHSDLGVLQALLARGHLESRLGHGDQAVVALREARTRLEDRSPLLLRCQVLQHLAEALAATGRHAEAYEVQRDFIASFEKRLGLASRARYFAVQIRFELDRMRAERDALREQAVRDPLTGLYNRRYLDAVLDELLVEFGRSATPLALVMIDIDHFKQANDRYGHPFGDEVLRSFALVLKAGTRGGDIVCRYGGEEFCLVLPHATGDDGVARAQQLLATLVARPVSLGDVKVEGISFSAGVAAFPAGGTTRDALIAAADASLYEAKRAGRARVVRS